MSTDLNRKLRLRRERLGLIRLVEEPIPTVTTMQTTYNGRQVPMSLRKLEWLDRVDATIKRLDAKTKT